MPTEKPTEKPKATKPLTENAWQDPTRPPIKNLREQLEYRARTGKPMYAFKLAYADLHDINLVNRGEKTGYHLCRSDLYRANLQSAHLFNLNLSGSSLMKANLCRANLNHANLKNCNLLGVILKNAKIEHVKWGNKVLQERQARRCKDRAKQIDLYQQAEEIYRNLRQAAEQQGLFENAGRFFQKEMVMRRRQWPRFSFRRNFSRLVDAFCGYGERPSRVISFSIMLIFIFATLYFFSGLNFNGELIAFSTEHSLWHNIKTFGSTLYFSVVTFTTLGYGDLTPVGITRALAAMEAFLGSFTLALFVVVFVKKMTR